VPIAALGGERFLIGRKGPSSARRGVTTCYDVRGKKGETATTLTTSKEKKEIIPFWGEGYPL